MSVTLTMLSTPGHGIRCDQCEKLAVFVMRRGDRGYQKRSGYYRPDPQAPVRVRCESHLNYRDEEASNV